MAHKRIILFTVIFAICYLIGVTWAETAAATQIQNNSVSSGVINSSSSQQNKNIQNSSNKDVTTSTAPSNNNSSTTNCVCDGALLPRLGENGKELEICAKCKCKHEARNTTLIKVVVIIVIWIISILVIYMLFLMCLDPLLNKRVKANYQEHTNEDDDPCASPPSMANPELSSRANVLNRVGHQQDKWKRQVREQRRHIYDRHTMLN